MRDAIEGDIKVSPPARGWSLERTGSTARVSGLPASAGMVPLTPAQPAER